MPRNRFASHCITLELALAMLPSPRRPEPFNRPVKANFLTRFDLLDVCSTGAANAHLGESVRSTEVANDVAVFPLQRQLLPFAFMYYFGSDLWRSPSNRCGPCDFPVMFSMTCGRDCGSECVAEPRRQLHAFFRKCDANYTPRRLQTATPTTRVPAPVAITDRYAMVRPLLGVGCPAAVDFVNRVIANARRQIAGPNGDCKA